MARGQDGGGANWGVAKLVGGVNAQGVEDWGVAKNGDGPSLGAGPRFGAGPGGGRGRAWAGRCLRGRRSAVPAAPAGATRGAGPPTGGGRSAAAGRSPKVDAPAARCVSGTDGGPAGWGAARSAGRVRAAEAAGGWRRPLRASSLGPGPAGDCGRAWGRAAGPAAGRERTASALRGGSRPSPWTPGPAAPRWTARAGGPGPAAA